MSQAERADEEPSTSTGDAAAELGGLFDGFEAYRTPTDADYRAVLTNGLLIPDTNVFLNLYRYNEQTRNDLFSVLRALGERLWVPRQVMVEFWRNREAVLQDPRDTDRTARELTEQRDKAVGAFRGWANRVGLPEVRNIELAETLLQAFNTVIAGVEELADHDAAEFARTTSKDPVLIELEPILRGRVGLALDEKEYGEALAEAKRRAEVKQPPGYKDFGKNGPASAGDYLIWVQVLHEAQREQRDVLIVTGDVKEDWWRREHGELRGPRPELAEEMNKAARVRLFLLRPERLLLQARQALRIDVLDQSVQDVERVDRSLAEARSTRGGTSVLNVDTVRDAWADVLEAVKGRRRVAWMLLANADVAALDGDVLIVEFARDGDVRGFRSSGCDKPLEEALHDVLGVELRVTAVLGTGLAESVRPGSPAGQPGSTGHPDPWTTWDGSTDEPPF